MKRILWLFLTGMLFTAAMAGAAQKSAQKSLRSSPNALVPQGTLLNINQISMWVYANGKSGITPNGNSGIIYPSGTAGVIFTDGIVWGGKVFDGHNPIVRAGGQHYSVGTVPGSILSPGIAEDFNNPAVNRIWRIRRDFTAADLIQDAAEFLQTPSETISEIDIQTVRNRYRQDWQEWPADKGAPFYDADRDGRYTPQFTMDVNGSEIPVLYPDADEPGLANADQVVWFVANDLEDSTVTALFGSPSIGIEMQTTLWGYNRRNDPLQNVVFKRVRLIYKGTAQTPADAHVDSMYLAQWSDPDIGSFTDDFVGSDILLNLGYAYNSNSFDRDYRKFNLPPPACGYDVLAGPMVPAKNREAIYDLKKRPDFVNRFMTAFGFFAAGGGDGVNRGGDYNGTLQWWNLLRGFRPRPERPADPWVNPLTGEPTKFVLTGDPVTGLGWIDHYSGDRRMHLASGPFTMALGDSNEMNLALVAGLGSDRLQSVTVTKFYDRAAQETFNNLFAVPKPPPKPTLSASELDGQIILNWGITQNEVERVETFDHAGFKFEGYNVYQLPSENESFNNGTKLATFDLKNEITTILEEKFDPASGTVIPVPVKIGKNTGLRYTFAVKQDSINRLPLINGQTYHFAVTSYSVNPSPFVARRFMESPPAVVSVTPHSLNPGYRLHAAFGDSIPVSHPTGLSTGKVTVKIVNPTQLTGDSYQVGFTPFAEKAFSWYLLNKSTGDTLLKNQFTQLQDSSIQVTDGFQVLIESDKPDYKRTAKDDPAFIEIANENGPLVEADFDDSGAPFKGNLVWHSLNSESSKDRYFLSTTTNDDSGLRTNFTQLIPDDYELIFTTLENGSWGWWAFTTGDVAKVPFQIWSIGPATPDDPSDDFQLIPIMFEGAGTPDAYTADHGPEGTFGFPAFDRIYWFLPAPGDSYADHAADAADGALATDHTGTEIIARLLVADFDGDGKPPRPGTIVRILTTKPNTQDDIYTFSTAEAAPTFSLQIAKQDVQKVNVFPNPYYGLFRFESVFPDNNYVTFTHLPRQATVRIFSLSGTMVRNLVKDDDSQFLHWNLLNAAGRNVASGLYVAHIEMPALGVTKTVKLVVIHE